MFCTKCGQQIPDGSAFCTFCGAQLSGARDESARDLGATGQAQEFGERVTWQQPPKPARRGLPAWGWVLIGCGGLVLLSFVALIAGGLFFSKKLTKEFGNLENMQVASEVTLLQTGMATYFDMNKKYGNFKELESASLLGGITTTSLEEFKMETDLGTYELLLAPDGLHYEFVGKSKKDGRTFNIDEKSGTVFDDMFGIDTSGAASSGGK